MKIERLASLKKMLKRLDSDQRGAEGLEKLLIIAAIVLPLLGLLIWMRDEIKTWVTDLWNDQTEAGETDGWTDGG